MDNNPETLNDDNDATPENVPMAGEDEPQLADGKPEDEGLLRPIGEPIDEQE